MKLYLAGIYTSNFHKESQLYARLTDRERAARDGVQHFLESFHYIHKQAYVDKIRADGVKVFLDSGAFSAFTKGVDVDIRGYCDYIKRNLDIIENIDGDVCASVLDGIGDPLKTWQNQQTMEQMGVRPLPCFHYGEDERYLEWYIQHYDYITLGGMVPISTPQLVYWLDRIWNRYLTDGSGRPRLKVHGFGLTAIPLMERYPWYSVDSSSWVQKAAMGAILVPGFASITVSDTSPARKRDGQHFDNYTGVVSDAIRKAIEDEGFEVDRLRELYLSRWAYNCWAYPEVGARLKDNYNPIFELEQETLF